MFELQHAPPSARGMSNVPYLPDSVSRPHRNLLIVTAVMTAVLITLGGVVCATRASGGCPDWPRCHGRLVPPPNVDSILEYSHRVAAMLTGILVIASAVVGWLAKHSGTALRIIPTIAAILTGVVAVFGAFAVLTGLPPILAAIDLGTAIVVLTLVITAAVVASLSRAEVGVRAARPAQSGVARLAVVTAVTLFTVIVSGVFVARGSVMRCIGGPMHIGTWASIVCPGWLHTPRQILAGAVLALAAALVVAAVRNRRVDPVTRKWSVAFGTFLAIEILHGAVMVSFGPTTTLLIASAAVTTAAWSALVVVAVRAHLASSDEPR